MVVRRFSSFFNPPSIGTGGIWLVGGLLLLLPFLSLGVQGQEEDLTYDDDFFIFGEFFYLAVVCFVLALVVGVLLSIWLYKDAEMRGKNGTLWVVVLWVAIFAVGIIGPIVVFIIWLVVRDDPSPYSYPGPYQPYGYHPPPAPGYWPGQAYGPPDPGQTGYPPPPGQWTRETPGTPDDSYLGREDPPSNYGQHGRPPPRYPPPYH